jgi:hypothetical protein
MAKKLTKLERSIQSASRRHKRKPYGLPMKRMAENLAVATAIVNRRKHKSD